MHVKTLKGPPRRAFLVLWPMAIRVAAHPAVALQPSPDPAAQDGARAPPGGRRAVGERRAERTGSVREGVVPDGSHVRAPAGEPAGAPAPPQPPVQPGYREAD